jgi:hypothetical protein
MLANYSMSVLPWRVIVLAMAFIAAFVAVVVFLAGRGKR